MILIALGSNLNSELYGSPLKNCLNGVKILRKNFFVKKVSKFYKTEPIPKSDQPWYVNGVVEIKTTLHPFDILKKLFFIENHFKRIRRKKNEPRIIDLDLICYNNLISRKRKFQFIQLVIISLISACNNKFIRNKFDLNKNSNVLLIGCEGDVDKVLYKKLLIKGSKN